MKSFALNAKSAGAATRIAQRPQLSCAHQVLPARTLAPLRQCDAPSSLASPTRLVITRALEDKNPAGAVAAKERGYVPRTTPSEEAMEIWKKVDAVCFDVDCTVTVNDSLDLLAEFLGCGEEVAKMTNQAMDGTVSLAESLEARLDLINCTPADIKRFIAAHPPTTRLAPGIEELIRLLQARGVAVYLISGGFREVMMPVAAHLKVPKENCYANRMNWQWDDETGAPTKLKGFDVDEPTARNKGKVEAIKQIRKKNPYNNIVMIGDGITDLEAVQSSHGADLFIGYGGIIERPDVASQAEWYIYDHSELTKSLQRYTVACVGSGAWACAALRMVAQNTGVDDPADEFVDEVRMWVHEAQVDGKKLTDIINETHENVIYLPGIDLGENIVAMSSLTDTVKDADCIILCAPHQYVHGICKQLVGKIKPGAIVCSLTKGMRVKSDGPQLISAMVSRTLNVDCSVLMGANIAADVGKEQLGEGVIGYSNLTSAKIWKKLFERPYFKVDLIPDVVGAEMCGTLKNIVALGAGMIDGMGYGSNSKSAILRQGLQEMRNLAKALYPTVRDDTFFQTCGMGDLIATCYGGRNRYVAEEWTKLHLQGKEASFEQLEEELLHGQKLQGVLTSDEVQQVLKMKGWEDRFPLFTTINRIINGQLPASWILRYEEGATIDLGSLSGSTEEEDDIPARKPVAKAPAKKHVQAPVLADPPKKLKTKPTPPSVAKEPAGKAQVPVAAENGKVPVAV